MGVKKLLFVLCLLTAPSFADADLKLFEAVYDLSVDGLRIAQEQRKLSKNNQTYTLVAKAKTVGLANFFTSYQINTNSRFIVKNHQLVTQQYQVLKKSGKKVTEDIQLTVVGGSTDLIINQNGVKKHYPYTDKYPLTDILNLSIALSMDVSLAQWQTQFHYQVLKKNALEVYDFTNYGKEIVTINGRKISSIKLVRTDKKRTLSIWLDPKQYYVPIIIEQVEKNTNYRYTLRKINAIFK